MLVLATSLLLAFAFASLAQADRGVVGSLVDSRNLCKAPNRAEVKLGAQNGRRSATNPKVTVPCRR